MNDLLTDTVGQLNKLPIAVALVLAINVLGLCLKSARFFPNKFIPLVSVAVGAITYSYIGNPGSISPDVRHPQCVLAVYGVLIGFIAWGTHKALVKRLEKYLPGFTSKGFDSTPPFAPDRKSPIDTGYKSD